MKISRNIALALAGGCAGAVNGLLGAGGGMLLVPLLSLSGAVDEEDVFFSSVAIILPICVISLIAGWNGWPSDAVPYLVGSGIGGIAAGLWGKKIPVLWLHRGLGLLILWGGIRYLWNG